MIPLICGGLAPFICDATRELTYCLIGARPAGSDQSQGRTEQPAGERDERIREPTARDVLQEHGQPVVWKRVQPQLSWAGRPPCAQLRPTGQDLTASVTDLAVLLEPKFNVVPTEQPGIGSERPCRVLVAIATALPPAVRAPQKSD